MSEGSPKLLKQGTCEIDEVNGLLILKAIYY